MQNTYGKEILSNTCRSYPRFVSSYGDLYIENIGFSCPASAAWVVGLKHLCKLEEKVYYENQSEVGKKPAILPSEKAMKYISKPFSIYGKFEEALLESYKRADEKYEGIPLKIECLKDHDLLLNNISVCFLFENLMLHSTKEKPDYIAVLDRLCFILKELDKKCLIDIENGEELTDIIISNNLYKVMRVYDHEM